MNTGIIVNREVWERANRDASSLNKFYQTKDGQILYRKMVAIDNAINNLLRQGLYDDASIKEAVESVVYAEVREQQRKEEEDRLAMKLEIEESKRKNVLAFLHNLIEGIKEGVIKHNGNRYSPNTCKVWTSFEHILTDFYNSNPFTWKMIDRRLADRFVYTFEKKGYLPKTINKYTICFRAMVGNAYQARLHQNDIAEKSFSKYVYVNATKLKKFI